MGSEPCVFDILSSDEDDVFVIKASALPPSTPSLKRCAVETPSSENNDDVVVLEKLPCLETRNRVSRNVVQNTFVVFKSSSLRSALESSSPRDERECCILECNPEKSLPSPHSHSNDDADLVVTGENGPVACRDYPHARHLCAKFPFKCAPHENFCKKCHCYVCDELAPCLFWGRGKQNSDHCHASDKERKWREMRQLNKSHTLQSPVSDSQPPILRTTCSRQPDRAAVSYGFSPALSLSLPPSNLKSFNSMVASVLASGVSIAKPVLSAAYSPLATIVRDLVDDARVSGTNNDNRATTGFYSQKDCGVGSRCGSMSDTMMAETTGLNPSGQHLQNYVFTSPELDTSALQSCSSNGSEQTGSSLQADLWGTSHGTASQPSTATNCGIHIDRPGDLSSKDSAQSCPAAYRKSHSSEPMTSQYYLSTITSEEIGKENLLSNNFSVSSESSSVYVHHPTADKELILEEQAVACHYVPQLNVELPTYNLTKFGDSYKQQKGSTSWRNMAGAQKALLHPVFEVPEISLLPQDSQTSEEVRSSQVSAEQVSDGRSSLDEILAQLDADDIWEQFDFGAY